MRGYSLLFYGFCFSIHSLLAQEQCASLRYFQQEVKNSPLLDRIQGIEGFIRHRLNKNETGMSPAGIAGGGLPTIKIPVVVHILYDNAEQKITGEQVQSQIDVLNRNFRKRNDGVSSLPDYFNSLAADCFIEFSLATTDPRGIPSGGIIWKKTSNSSFGSDDRIKFSQTGGSDAWDSDRYLNIWVGKLSPGIAGYSSVPGSVKEKDGIVLRYTAFGTIGTALAPYNLGHTAVHELGHWLALKHIWGDRYCGDDEIGDTPPQKGPTKGCPSTVITSCNNAVSGSMYMNYMDLTYDACTNMFTTGQRDRMRALFAEGGPRHSLLSSNGAAVPRMPVPVELPLDTLQSAPIHIFPNPARGIINITTGEEHHLQQIIIYNHLGQPVLRALITSKTMQMNINRLQNGLHFIKIGEQKKVGKFMKSKE